MIPRKSIPQIQSRRTMLENQPRNMTCQNCLQIGHWSYECRNQKVYLVRESRSSLLKKGT